MSLNVFTDDMSLNNMLFSIEGSGDFIKSQTGFADYYPGEGWFGTLESLNNVSMYKLKMIESDALNLWARPVDVNETKFEIQEGWNWIGYSPQNSLDINFALSNVEEGSLEYIKTQNGYADYYQDFGWFGNLDDLHPFTGYLVRASQNTNFTYNDNMFSSVSAAYMPKLDQDEFDLHSYENNGTLTTAIYIDDNRVDSYDYELRAYSGTDLVGYTEGLYFPFDGNIVFPLMVYGNEAGNTLSLEVYNKATDTYLDVAEQFIFTPDMKLGDGFDPVVLNTMDQPIEHSISAAYPNPFNPVVNFDVDLNGEHYVDARVYNISGQEVAVLHNGLLSGSAQTLSWVATNQSSGIYFIRIVVDGVTTINNKVILLK